MKHGGNIGAAMLNQQQLVNQKLPKEKPKDEGQQRIQDAGRRTLVLAEEVQVAWAEALRRRLTANLRPRLRWARNIAWILAALRTICYVILLVCFFNLRFNVFKFVIEMIDGYSANLLTHMVSDVLMAWFCLCVFLILFEIVICVSVYYQNAICMALTYAGDLVLFVLLIALATFTTSFIARPSDMTSSLLGSTARGPPGLNLYRMDELQTNFKCCGFVNHDDWLSRIIFKYKDTISSTRVSLRNSGQWMRECAVASGQNACVVPKSCCKSGACHIPSDNVTFGEFQDFLSSGSDKYQSFNIQSASGEVYDRGCVAVVQKYVEGRVILALLVFGLLTILTLLMTLIIIVLILYHGSLGNIRRSTRSVRPSSKNRMVWFFMWLDGLVVKDSGTLTDFSIIEEIKRMNVDDAVVNGGISHDEWTPPAQMLY